MEDTDVGSLEGDAYAAGSAALPDEPKELYEGDNAIEQAVEALQTKRDQQARQRPRLPEESEDEDPGVVKLRWQDGRPENTPITLKQAADSYSGYRENLQRQIMEGIAADWDAQAAQEAQPETEQQQTEAQETPEAQWAKYYEGLQPAERAHIDSALQFQQKAQQTEQAALVYETALVDFIARLTGSGQWGDIRTVEDAQRLQVQDPARFAQLQQHVQTVQAVQSEALRVHQQRQQQEQAVFEQNYKSYATQEDRKAETLIPELRSDADPESQRRLMLGAIDTLKSAGFTDAELHGAWVKGHPIYLRDARAQRVLASATRWELANSQAAKNDLRSKRVFAPQPQRPGTSNTGDTASFHNERAIAERLKKSGSIHDAVALYQSRKGRR